MDPSNPKKTIKSTSAGSNSFELQIKADEWIDVTPTEDVLRAELVRLQDAFDKCTKQLDSSRLENDLLKDRGIALEHEVEDLKSTLKSTHVNLEATQKKLFNVKQSYEEERESLRASHKKIAEKQACADQAIISLETKLDESHKQRLSESSLQKVTSQRLEHELKASKEATKKHKDAAIRFAEDLREARENHKQTKVELGETKKALSSEMELHSKATKTLGTVATLAEKLKIEKQNLKRSQAREHSSRTEAESKNIALTKQLTDLRALHDEKQKLMQSELFERLNDLKGSNKSIETLQIELKDAENKLRKSFLDRVSIEEHVARIEQDRHDLLSEREAELETKLIEQKVAFENRLKKIHSILGLKFTTALQSEVRTIRNSAIEQMPKLFKSPLLQ